MSANSIVERFTELVKQDPQAQAIVWLDDGERPGESYTRSELDEKAAAIAYALDSLDNFRNADEKLVLMVMPEDGPGAFPAAFGVFYAGGAIVPLPFAYTAEQILAVVSDTCTQIIITSRSGLDDLKERIPSGPVILAWEDLAESGGALRKCPDPDSLAYIAYTSGSVSNPRGVCFTHKVLIDECAMFSEIFEMDKAPCVNWMPLYHISGLVCGGMNQIYAGELFVCMSPPSFTKKPSRLFKAVSKYRGGLIILGASLMAMCSKIPDEELEGADLSCLKNIIEGGEPLQRHVSDAFLKKLMPCGLKPDIIVSCWGQTEACGLVSYCRLSYAEVDAESIAHGVIAPGDFPVASCGTPSEDTEVAIVDLNSGKRIEEDNVIGEFWVKCSRVASGYYRKDAETEFYFNAKLDGESWLNSGDMGFKRDNILYVTGRSKEMIKVSDRCIFPADVERAAAKASPVFSGISAAFGVSGDFESIVLVAETDDISEEEFKAEASKVRLQAAKELRVEIAAILSVPHDAIPRVSFGKVKRSGCKEAYLAGDLDIRYVSEALRFAGKAPETVKEGSPGEKCPRAGASASTPADDEHTRKAAAKYEKIILSRLAAELEIEGEISQSDASFADMGLSSAGAIRVSAFLEEMTGIAVSPALMWSYPTPRRLAFFLAGADEPAAAAGSCSNAAEAACASAADDSYEKAVAVIGMACRFPGGIHDLGSFREKQRGGCEEVIPFPLRRRLLIGEPLSGKLYKGHYIHDLDRFDAAWFGLSEFEAAQMDPQQRLALDLSAECLENAGIDPFSLKGSRTGVFIGACYSGLHSSQEHDSAWELAGSLVSMIAGRVSYHLGLIGPAIVFDTACSSGLTAIYEACRSLYLGDCSMAIAGGISLNIFLDWLRTSTDIGMITESGRCFTFDKRACGFGVGEGGGLVALKRFYDAKRDGDNILAVVRGGAINQDGASNGISAPNGKSQEDVISKALEMSGLEPGSIDYVEAHGTGTPLGDPIELMALSHAYKTAEREVPLAIGSVKTLLGHTEAASGAAGLISAVLGLIHKEFPASCNFRYPTEFADWTGMKVQPPGTPWPSGQNHKRRAGVSAFGLSGTNVHLIVEESEDAKLAPTRLDKRKPVLLRSGRTASYGANIVEWRSCGGFGEDVSPCRWHFTGLASSSVKEGMLKAGTLTEKFSGNVVYLAGSEPLEKECAAFLVSAQECVRSGGRMWLVTFGAQAVGGAGRIEHAPLWAIARCLNVEHPEVRCISLDLDENNTLEDAVRILERMGASQLNENEYVRRMADCGDGLLREFWYAPRWARNALLAQSSLIDPDKDCRDPYIIDRDPNLRFSSNGIYLITGGLGGLGLAVAEFLASHGARKLALVSRHGPKEPWQHEALARLKEAGCEFIVRAADAADSVAMGAFISELESAGGLKGVFHLAASFDLKLMRGLNEKDFADIFHGKVHGALTLHKLTERLPLDYFVMFSSIAASLPSPGQAVYAAANAALDALAAYRHHHGLPAQALAWSSFTDGGIGARKYLDLIKRLDDGLSLHTVPFGMQLLEAAISTDAPSLIFTELNVKKWLDYYPQWRGTSMFAEYVKMNEAAPEAAPDFDAEKTVMELVSAFLGRRLADNEKESSFADLGFDSLMAVEMRNRLQHYTDKALPVTLLFSHPSPADLIYFLDGGKEASEGIKAEPSAEGIACASDKAAERESSAAGEPAGNKAESSDSEASDEKSAESGMIAVIGLGCRLPGGIEGPEDFFEALCGKREAIAVPDYSISSWRSLSGKPGGYLKDANKFDPEFFGMTVPESKACDPAQRFLLETAWQALEDAGIEPDKLKGRDAGIFVGISDTDFTEESWRRQEVSVWSGTGAQVSAAAGRIAYVLGTSGPAIVVNAACASGLVALHAACQSLRAGECSMALAAGVNFIMTLRGDEMLDKVGIFSASGHCYAFGDKADGFVRGEGCAAVVLKPLEAALADGDPVRAVIRGTAVNNDGHGNGFGVPNPKAQRAVIAQVLHEAGLSGKDIDFVEGHGSATPLGDLIELESLDAELGSGRSCPLYVGSVKGNIGHTEGAAGMVGLVKAVLCLEHGRLAPSLYGGTPNKEFSWDNIRLCGETLELSDISAKAPGASYLAGISAFGLTGTNAHAVIESRPEKHEHKKPRKFKRINLNGPDNLLYEAAWRECPRAEAKTRISDRPGYAIIYAPSSQPLAEMLAAKLNSAGAGAAETVALSEKAPADFTDSRYVFLIGPDCRKASGMEARRKASERAMEADQFVKFAFRMLKNTGDDSEIMIVTRGVWKKGGDMRVKSRCGEVWGLGRCQFSEFPNRKLRLCDTGLAAEQAASALAEEIPCDDCQVRLEDKRLAFRLERASSLNGNEEDLKTGYCLISGGTGALGRALCQRLAENAECLVLWKRSYPTEEEFKFAEELPCRAEFFISSPEELGEKLGQLRKAYGTDIVWDIFHLAGTIEDNFIGNMSEESFDRVVNAKRCFLEALEESRLKLGRIVLFSALSSVLGGAGQSNYDAGNAYLDVWGIQNGAICVNWGPINAGIGARRSEEMRRHTVKLGIYDMDLDDALNLLPSLCSADLDQNGICVAALDFRAMSKWVPDKLKGLLGELLDSEEEKAQALSMTYDDVLKLIADSIAKITGTRSDDDNQTFGDLGFSSLDSIEMRNLLSKALHCDLPATICFDYPAPKNLAKFVCEKLSANQAKPSVEQEKPSAEQAALSAGKGSCWYEEPIAVAGMACRLPGCDSPEELFSLLESGTDPLEDIPLSRWDIRKYYSAEPAPGKMVCRRGGFLKDIDIFDTERFGISPREAKYMDPQQRIMLEMAAEAVASSGAPLPSWSGTKTGVYLGMCAHDYTDIIKKRGSFEAWAATGNSFASASGRIAYVLGLEGPAMTVDTACSSSLLAVHLACESLRRGECSAAIAGGVNIMLDPDNSVLMSSLQALSPTSACHVFSEKADGYVRSEGCAAVFLMRLSDAQKLGLHIYAVIKGTAVSQDGRSSGFSAPRGPAQEVAMREALERSGAGMVDFVEAHGVGTQLGDPIEMGAIDAVFGKDRQDKLPVGALKSNIGHTEAASGAAALIKAIMEIRHKRITANLHFETPNPFIAWDKLNVRAASSAESLPEREAPLRAGVNAFGITGTNVCVIAEEYKGDSRMAAEPLDVSVPEKSRFALAAALAEDLEGMRDHVRKARQALSSGTVYCPEGTSGPYRFAAVLEADDADELLSGAETLLESGRDMPHRDELPAGIYMGKAADATEPVMLFTGQGSQYGGMGKELYSSVPSFANSLNALLDRETLDVMFGDDEEKLALPQYAQLSIYAMGVSLFKLWKELGVSPCAVLGHSLGEFVAACSASVFSEEEGLKIVRERARLMKELPCGAMAAVWAGESKTKELIGSRPLFISAVNSPLNCVVSGLPDDIDDFLEELKEAKAHFTKLPAFIAGHSPMLTPVIGDFSEFVGKLEYAHPACPYISAVTGECEKDLRGDYWTKHLQATVRFAEAMKRAKDFGNVFIEIGAQPALSAMGAVCLLGGEQLFLPSLRPGRGEMLTLLQSVSAAFAAGVSVDWKKAEALARAYSGRSEAHSCSSCGADSPAKERKGISCWFDDSLAPSAVDRRVREQGLPSDGDGALPGSAPDLEAHQDYAGAEYENCDDIPDGDFRCLAKETLEVRGEPDKSSSSWVWLGPEEGGVRAEIAEAAADLGISLGFEGTGDLVVFSAAGCAETERRVYELIDAVKSAAAANASFALLCCHEPGLEPAQSALWAAARACAVEYPNISIKSVFCGQWLESGAEIMRCLQMAFCHKDLAAENELLFERGENGHNLEISALRMKSCARPAESSADLSEGTFVITGGTGGLGASLAAYLAERGARKIVAISRQRPMPDEFASRIAEAGAELAVLHADVSDPAALLEALAPYLDDVRGIFHLAGTADPALVPDQTPERLHEVFKKAKAAQALHEISSLCREGKGGLEFFVMYSSVGCSMPSPGQSTYAAANGYLEGLAQLRLSQGLPASVVAWPLVSGRGMTADYPQWRRLLATGMGAVSSECVCRITLSALASQAEAGAPASIAGCWNLGHVLIVLPLEISAWLNYYPSWQGLSLLSGLAGTEVMASETGMPLGKEDVLKAVYEEAAACLGYSDGSVLSRTKAFRDLGMDSLMAVELSNRLNRRLNVKLSAVATFDYPDIASLSEYLQGILAVDEDSRAAEEKHAVSLSDDYDPPVVIGMACRFPGSSDCDEYWQELMEGRDAITEVPPSRFDINEWYDPNPGVVGKTCCRYGGFLDSIETDYEFFGIAKAEADVMDPHQGVLLETVWEALENAGIAPSELSGTSAGVYAAVSNNDFQSYKIDLENINAWTGTGGMPSVIAGRISYILGLTGPAIMTDTACSSSLTALHLACRALDDGDCDMAIVGGVNVILSPYGHVFHSRLGGMAPDGKCRAFDADACGLVRSEGCGVVIVKKLSRALADKNRILAVIKGTAVNHDGRSNGLTAPNAERQKEVMRKALQRACLDPADVGYLEAHGTGTPLGDQIEMQSIEEVYGKAHTGKKLIVGSVKGNIGHCEGAAGMSGLIKAILALRAKLVPRNIHFHKLNPNIPADIHVLLPQENVPWFKAEDAGPRRAAVSAFGISGTNAHVILEECNKQG
ncbi:MAG: SDR family NAD(P)-dependent oxidoreductase [bacterium]|nr:SDR family NAD(P)-dependent oxidoreductase [bacterium]